MLVHEITHILQAVSRHSETGIMRARWDEEDLLNMYWKPLEFEPRDIDLINRGLAARAARQMVALNTAPAAVAAH